MCHHVLVLNGVIVACRRGTEMVGFNDQRQH